MSDHLEGNEIPHSRQREKPSRNLKYIGKDVNRVEDPRLLVGKARYIDDVVLPNMGHAAVLKSPYAHARLRNIDTSKASALPGVTCVLTGEDIAKIAGPVASFAQPPVEQRCVAIDRVRHVGEAVAIAVADSRYLAEDALELIDVEYEPLPFNTDPTRAAEATGDAVLHPERGPTNVIHEGTYSFGEVEKDFESADLIVRRRLRWGRSGPQPLETVGAVAEYDVGADRYIVHSNSNFYSGLGWYLAASLNVPSTKLKMIPAPAGGSFGSKLFNHKVLVLTCALARAAERPVKYMEDRLDNILNADAHGSDRLYDAELAVNRDGTLVSLRFTVIDDYGAYVQFGFGTHGNVMAQVTGPYTIRSVQAKLIAVVTNKCQQGAFRGFGSEVSNFVLERMVDAAADELGLDRIELRKRNLIQPEQFPYMIPTGNIYDSGNYPEVLREALRLGDLEKWRRLQAKERKLGRYIGIGVATCQERSVYSPTEWWSLNPNPSAGFPLTSAPEGLLVRVDPTGKIFAQLTSPFWGNSPETVVTQALAEQFDVPPSDIVVGYADSDTAFDGFGPGGSRVSVMLIGAAVSCALKLKRKLRKFAGHMLSVEPERLEFRDGKIGLVDNPKTRVSLAEVAMQAHFFRLSFPDEPDFDSGLETTAVYDHPLSTLPHPERRHLGIFYPIMGHMAHVAVVEVDAETGKVQFLHYASVHDAGTIINPKGLEGQARGGTAMGIGTALYEEFNYDETGQLRNANFAEYCIPTAHELPRDIIVGHVETPSPYTEYGVKGGGEGGRMGAPSAVASAIEDALRPFGVAIECIPATPARIRALIRSACSAVDDQNQAL